MSRDSIFGAAADRREAWIDQPSYSIVCRVCDPPQREARLTPMWLLLAALFGLLVPNGLFIYWLFAEFSGVAAVLHDKLALAFILDALVALIVLTVYFAKRPIGPRGWAWFVVLSFIGGLGFSLPFYYWLNQRSSRE